MTLAQETIIQRCAALLPGPNLKACNKFVARVAQSLDVDAAQLAGKTATAQVAYLRSSSGWQNLGAGNAGAAAALAAANEGKFVIAGWANPRGAHGHVAVVVSGAAVNGWPRGYWGQFPNGPGGYNASLRLTFGEAARLQTEFFAHELAS